MNVTVTAPTASGHVTVYPDDVSRPTASNLNFVAGLTVPNLVEVRVPDDNGVVDFHVFANGGSAHLLTDVVGYYDGDKSTEAGRFITGTPIRIIGSREASPTPPPGCFPGDAALVLTNPNTIVGGMVLNTTVTAPTDPRPPHRLPRGPEAPRIQPELRRRPDGAEPRRRRLTQPPVLLRAVGGVRAPRGRRLRDLHQRQRTSTGRSSRVRPRQEPISTSSWSCHEPHHGQSRMLTARATTRMASTSETDDSTIIANFAQRESGITSVGLNAVALVNDV